MNNSFPETTVLLPVYNGEKYLDDAITSILCQNYEDFELLIINDHSKDDSKQIIESHKDKRIRIVNNDINLGLTKTLNKGIEISNGKYIARLDQDDFSSKKRLSTQIDFIKKNKKIKLLGTWTKIVDSNKNFIKSLRFPTKRKNIIKAMCFYNPFIHSSVLFEKKIIMKLGGYPNDYVHASDYLLWCKIIRNYNVENIDEELTIIRYHSDRSTLRPDKISYVKNESNKIHIYALKNNELKLYLYIFGYFITFFRRFRFFSFIIEKIINLSLSFRRN